MTSTSNDPPDQDQDWAEIARYLGGALAPDEARAFERWWERDDSRRQLLSEARVVWAAAAPPSGDWDTAAGIQRLRQAVGATVAPTSAAPAPRRRRIPSRAWPFQRLVPVALAASLAALVLSGVALWSFHRSLAPTPVMTEVATSRGQRATVLLPDGSRVTLGVASKLWYPRDFGISARTLRLDGEAYFEVIHDAARPFRVLAGAGELEDVGTAFAVRAYGGPAVRVVVTEGVVVVRRPTAPGDSAVLAAGALAQVDDRAIVQQTNVPVADYIAWMQGELVFRDAPLTAVAEELARWYDLEVRVGTPGIAARRFTGSFRRQPIEMVIQAIAAAADVAVERTNAGWLLQ